MESGSEQGREEQRQPVVSGLDPCFEPLAAVVRGAAVESIHRGTIAVVDDSGALLGSAGDPASSILLRSAAKPFQAAAVVESGAADAFGLSETEIAIMAASHRGTPEHVAVVSGLLDRVGIPVGELVCGSLEHMCSGKHAGMLLLAAHLGVPHKGYHYKEHPVQRRIRACVVSLLDDGTKPQRTSGAVNGTMSPRMTFAGSEGCGVPVICMSLKNAARLFALLAAGATPALARVRDAMLAHPVLVDGEGRIDTTLIQAGEGNIIAKRGAEGVQGIGLRSTRRGSGSLGAAVKIEDGSSRPIAAITAALLDAWGLSREATAVAGKYSQALLDVTGREVGRIETLVEPAALRRGSGTVSVQTATTKAAGTNAAGTAAGTASTSVSASRGRLFARKGERVTVCRGDERDVYRFLREQWPAVDREYFGRSVDWTAEPYCLVNRRDGEVTAVLRGHFIGGVASVDELMVREGSRGCGVGSLLLGQFEEEAHRRHCARIVVRAVKDTPAEDFYRKRGYHRECIQYGYEFGYDYVRLMCDVGKTPGESGVLADEDKGER